MKPSLGLFASCFLAFGTPQTASAINFYWDGTSTSANADGGDGTWDAGTSTNWDNAAVAGADIVWPGTGTDNDAIFAGTAGTVTVDGTGVAANSLTFSTAGYVIQGGKVTLNGTTPTISNAVAATINSEVAGSGGLTKTGAGILTLGGANSFTGTTNISGGTVVAAHVSALTTSTTVNISTTSGAGTLRLATDSSVGAYKIGGSSSNQGTVISDRATAGAGITHVLGTANFGSNTYNFQAGSNVTSGTAGISFSSMTLSSGGGGTTTLNPTTASLTIVGGISSSNTSLKTIGLGGTNSGNAVNGAIANGSATVSLSKSNTSTWTLGGANSYTGATSITGGTLIVTHATALGSTAAGTTVASGATLAVSGGVAIGAEALNLSGNGVGNVGAIQNISGTNSMSGAVTLAAATRIGVDAGSLEMSGAFSGGQALTAVGAGTLILSGGGTFGQVISGNSSIPAGGNLEWKNGTGTTAGNYFGVGDNVSASFTLSGGSLTASPTSSLFVGSFTSSTVTGTMNISGGTFTMGNNNAIYVGGGGYNGNFSGNGSLNVSNGIFSTGTTTGTFRMGANAASQSGDGVINLSGTGTFETARSISKGAQGNATVNFDGGTYKLMATQATMFGTGLVTNIDAGGAKFDTNTFDGTISTVLEAGSPSGGLTKLGTGTLTLTQANTYTGTTTVSAGALQLGNGGTTGSLSTSSAIVNNASLIINRSNAMTQGTDFSGAAITGTGSLTKVGAGTLTLNVANSHSGGTIIAGSPSVTSALRISNGSALGTGNLTIGSGGNSDQSRLELTGGITVANSVVALTSRNNLFPSILNVSGNNTMSANLSSGGGGSRITMQSDAGKLTLSGNFSAGRGLLLAGAGDGEIQGSTTIAATYGLEKSGNGTWTVNAGNLNSTTATVSAGTLLIDGTLANSSATVNGGTLGGTGSISGPVTINTTGVLSPGASIETFATGALTLNTGSTFAYELNTTAITGDLLDVNGDLDLNGLVTLSLTDLGTNSVLANGTKFTLISYFGSWTSGDIFSGYADDSDFTLFGNEWRINYDDVSAGSANGGAFSNAVTLTVIPEPAAALLGGLGLLSLLRRRR